MPKLKSLVLLLGVATIGLILLVSFRIYPEEVAVSAQKESAGNAAVPVRPRGVAAVYSNSTWRQTEGIVLKCTIYTFYRNVAFLACR